MKCDFLQKFEETNWGQKSAEVETGLATAHCLVLLEDNVTKSVTELSKIEGRGYTNVTQGPGSQTVEDF